MKFNSSMKTIGSLLALLCLSAFASAQVPNYQFLRSWYTDQRFVLKGDTSLLIAGSLFTEYDTLRKQFRSFHPQNEGYKMSNLLERNVNDIFLDRRGHVWLGFNDHSRLFRHNGNSFDLFDPSGTSLGLIYPGSAFARFQEDSAGNVWAAYTSGLIRYDGANWKSITEIDPSAPTLKFDQISDLAILPSSHSFYITRAQGLLVLEKGQWKEIVRDVAQKPLKNLVGAKLDKTGRLWFFKENYTWDTLYSYSNDTVVRQPLPVDVPVDIGQIAVDPLNRVWVSSNIGLFCLDKGTWSIYNAKNGYPFFEYKASLQADKSNNLWVGLLDHLCKFYGTSMTKHSPVNMFESGAIAKDMAVDSLGHVWYATYNVGLVRFDGKWFKSYTPYNSDIPSSKEVNNVDMAPDGRLWVGTDKGLRIFNPKTEEWSKLKSGWDTLADETIYDVAFDRNGSAWIAHGIRLSRYRNGSFKHFGTNDHPDLEGYFTQLRVDEHNQVWTCADNKLFQFSQKGIERYYYKNMPGLRNSPILDFEIKGGITWISFKDSGLVVLDGKSAKPFSAPEFNNVESGLGLAFDSKGTLWISKNVFLEGGGLYALTGNTLQSFTLDNGQLPFARAMFYLHLDQYDNVHCANSFLYFIFRPGGINLDYQPFVPERYAYRNKLYLDLNKNNQKEGEDFFLANQLVMLGPDSIYAYTDSTGEFTFYVKRERQHWLQPIQTALFQYDHVAPVLVPAQSKDVEGEWIPARKERDSVASDLHITASPLRCDREARYWISYMNQGNVPYIPTIQARADSSLTFLSSYPRTADSLRPFWKLPLLFPGQMRTVQQGVKVGPWRRNLTEITLRVTEEHEDLISFYRLSSPFLCSYDPNDKQVEPARGGKNYTLFSEELRYTVRFQNTGNDTAFHVDIFDTLSRLLDVSSFRLLGASHGVKVSFEENTRLLRFSFEHILLPDSGTNEVQSHGFVSFALRPRAGLSEFAKVDNRAFIYFDYNEPVETNWVSNTLVSRLPDELSASGSIFMSANQLQVFPNPTTDGVLKVQSSSPWRTLRIISIEGHVLYTRTSTAETQVELSIPSLPKGIYLLETEGEQGTNRVKVIKVD